MTPNLSSTTLRIGLLGGSFNPAHEGHLHISRMARRALGLDEVWWLVSPQNPLKSSDGMAPFAERLARAQALAKDRGLVVTDLETRLGTRYTVDTVHALAQRAPRARFVWLMGADNALQFRKWKRWTAIAETLPIAVYPRPGFTLKARLGPFAQRYAAVTLDASDGRLLPDLAPPAIVFLAGATDPASATALRNLVKPSR